MGVPRPSAHVAAAKGDLEYVALFKCKLGDHRLCVAAEIDARDAGGAYVELKTNKLLACPPVRSHSSTRVEGRPSA